MLASMHDRENRDRGWLDAVEHSEWESANLRSANAARPDWVKIGTGTNAIPARFHLRKKFQPESAPLKFVPKEMGLQFELCARADA
jgi:hypothetical protein